MIINAFHVIGWVFFFILVFQIIIRLVRHFYKFPIPAFMVALIDNPLRRKIHPPSEMPLRHELKPGMRVLEVGPGNGTYSVGTAEYLGVTGRLITLDIQPAVIRKVKDRACCDRFTTIEGIIADVHHLPFKHSAFDAVFMIAVIGEIPKPQSAIVEFARVLSPAGTLAFSEVLFDPDYPLFQTLEKWAGQAHLQIRQKTGNFITYTALFEKKTSPT